MQAKRQGQSPASSRVGSQQVHEWAAKKRPTEGQFHFPYSNSLSVGQGGLGGWCASVPAVVTKMPHLSQEGRTRCFRGRFPGGWTVASHIPARSHRAVGNPGSWRSSGPGFSLKPSWFSGCKCSLAAWLPAVERPGRQTWAASCRCLERWGFGQVMWPSLACKVRLTRGPLRECPSTYARCLAQSKPQSAETISCRHCVFSLLQIHVRSKVTAHIYRPCFASLVAECGGPVPDTSVPFTAAHPACAS